MLSQFCNLSVTKLHYIASMPYGNLSDHPVSSSLMAYSSPLKFLDRGAQ